MHWQSLTKKLVLGVVAALGVALFIALAYVAPHLLLTPRPSADAATVRSVETLDRYLAERTSEGIPPAVDVTVLQGGKTVFAKSYGVANGLTGEPARRDHVYHFWSITKSLTAAAVFQLEDQGRVDLDTPVTTYLPRFQPVNERGEPVAVSLSQLLNHTSGLPDFDRKMFAWLHGVDEPHFGDTRMVEERLGDHRTLEFAPGTESAYRNINYVLLGAVIEAVTGDTYEAYVVENIMRPLGMTSSDFVYRPDLRRRAVLGTQAHYCFFTPMVDWLGPEGGLDGMTTRVVDGRHWLELVYTDYAASTSALGTGADLSRFGQMLLEGGTFGGRRVLSEASARRMLQGGRLPGTVEAVAAGDEDEALGFGTMTWVEDGVELIGHGGGGPGYSLQYLVVPEKELVVVVLTNATMGDAETLAKLTASVF